MSDQPVKRYNHLSGGMFEIRRLTHGRRRPPNTKEPWILATTRDRDIKALRKRGRGWKHRTWLYRERLTYEERVTLKQAKTIELLQKLLRRERYEVLHDRGCDCDLCAAVDAALKEDE